MRCAVDDGLRALVHVVCQVGEPVTINDCKALVMEIDTNGDGTIGFDEFTQVRMARSWRSALTVRR